MEPPVAAAAAGARRRSGVPRLLATAAAAGEGRDAGLQAGSDGGAVAAAETECPKCCATSSTPALSGSHSMSVIPAVSGAAVVCMARQQDCEHGRRVLMCILRGSAAQLGFPATLSLHAVGGAMQRVRVAGHRCRVHAGRGGGSLRSQPIHVHWCAPNLDIRAPETV